MSSKDSCVNGKNFDDLNEFDFSITNPDFTYPEQPYMTKIKLLKSNNSIKCIRTGKCYEKKKGLVRYSTIEGKQRLAKFKKHVLDRCKSSFGTFYDSCYDELLNLESVKEDVNDELSFEEKKRMSKLEITKYEIDRRLRTKRCVNKFLFFNEKGRIREGSACHCSTKEREIGIYHDVYPGDNAISHCFRGSNNLDKLYHYVLKITRISKTINHLPTSYLEVDNEIYYFEGFSIFLHEPISNRFPATSLNQCYDDFEWELIEAEPPTHFTIEELEAFHDYLFGNILEIFDYNRFGHNKTLEDSCPFYHCYPRFALTKNREIRILSMSDVLSSLRRIFKSVNNDIITEKISEELFLNPEKRPKALRIDSITKDKITNEIQLIHTTILPSIMLQLKDPELECYQTKVGRGRLNRMYNVKIPYKGYYKTGLFSDIAIAGLHVIAAIAQIRIRKSISYFEDKILKFKLNNPVLLELALMHPSFKASYGANSSHCRTSVSNCGYFDVNLKTKKNIRRRGFETLLDAMNVLVFGEDKEFEEGFIYDNERLEYLGDAVVGFVITTRIFLMYPHADEGFLATSRSALVRNETLAHLAKKLNLNEYILLSHGTDVTTQMDIDHALANTFEALMGAIYIDQGAKKVDILTAKLLFKDNIEAYNKWIKPPIYLLKQNYPYGDRHLIKHIEYLEKLTKLEDSIGIYFTYIRILARVFTKRCIGDNFLTLGDNQTLEFLGDSILQLAITVRLYMMFPYHNEGNLSLLRSCLVSNHTQSLICDDLKFEQYVIVPEEYEQQLFTSGDVRKDKADLMEAFLGALYVDKGLDACIQFCDICYFPRLKRFIMSQTWNDPKSLLQQCCLMLKSETNDKPHVPSYKLLNQSGPTNNRQYVIGVYINGNRLATGIGNNIKQAEMDAASEAVLCNAHIFPIATVAKSLYFLKNQYQKTNDDNESFKRSLN